MRKQIRKALSLALSAVLCLSLIPARALAVGGNVPIDEEHFPDPALRMALTHCLPAAKDGILTPEEIADTTILEISRYGGDGLDPYPAAKSLAGIEIFTNLGWLYCCGHQLTELDLSPFPELVVLDCRDNRLTELDPSHNPKLICLKCGDNRLTSLDLSQNPKMGEYYNVDNIRSLDEGTPLSQLPGLDLTKVTNLKGGSFEGGKVNFTDSAITYDYDVQLANPSPYANPITTFTLVRSFDDVPEQGWFTKPVQWAVAKGITRGMTADEFGPVAPCNRAQIVTFLWKMLDAPKPQSANNPFTDVPQGAWFTNAVLWAVENSITKGMTDTEFGSTVTCSRAQAMMFLWKANGSYKATAELTFTDVPENAWYCEAVRWAVESGVTKGISETEFGPNLPCNRAQIVTFLYAADQLNI